ncbi:MAG: 50S ribosomal protein L19e [Candidatus Thalassarchaeaceae archaeon]|jgi:large subunit ribosomal protein L19e|nr:50S ribosomal protein L19e [Candidatus Thalassarchaeaceae archaeon]MDP6147769.1 50S ribosomal protein L19e [Candidatus Thalassarchaeaceae archaeon]MDP7659272.1 50S ribosomal protein L19e [Candidatus Thalassarchaeaceae archaeon]PDH25039.1 MAG: 50S ribosomal protein L19e [Marine Group II euryarchaeote MED-G36]HJO42743.1 50S ribosomal protein L19e [Candidatus Thalassarchaeaceae archaeon]|tara:strand:+ start:828 stop:1310 length:483 start_codon:yes stop_codon:yes gene_type:complete
MMITNQKRLAAEIFSKREGRKVGVHRIWVDPSPQALDEVANAVQKEDVRRLIEEGIIKSRPLVGTSRSRARKASAQKAKGRRTGHGSRKGSANARHPRKSRWMRTIRAQRKELKSMRESESITASEYRYYYRKAKGGSYRSVSHMRSNMEIDGIELGGEQ